MDSEKFAKDGGYGSRKFWFSVYTSVVIVVAAKMCPAAVLPEVVAGLVAVCGIFVTGNVVNRWTIAKTFSQGQEPPKNE